MKDNILDQVRFDVMNADCLDALRNMPDCSVDAIVTDPPYGLSQHSSTDIQKALTSWLAGDEYKHGKAGFMGKSWDSFVPSPSVWRECFRVLKHGGHILCFAGSRTQDLMSIALRLAGFECRDTVMWVYGSGYPKSMDVSKAIDKALGKEPATDAARQWQGWGTALKPAYEPVLLFRKPLSGTVAENVLKHGTGALNIDGCRVGSTVETWPKSRSYAPGQRQPGGNGCTQPTGEAPAGRWPANLIHDGSEEPVQMFGDAARFFYCAGHEKEDLLFCRAKAIMSAWKLTKGVQPCSQENASVAESSLCLSRQAAVSVLSDAVIAASRGDRLLSDARGLSTTATESECERLCETLITAMLISESVALPAPSQDVLIKNGCHVNVAAIQQPTDTMTITISLPKSGGYAEHVTFSIMPSSMAHGAKGLNERFRYCAKASKKDRGEANIHPTVKPTDLMRYLCRLITPPNGVILDPFMGSGSTGKAAMLEGFRFIGIEQSPEYFAIARARINSAISDTVSDKRCG